VTSQRDGDLSKGAAQAAILASACANMSSRQYSMVKDIASVLPVVEMCAD